MEKEFNAVSHPSHYCEGRKYEPKILSKKYLDVLDRLDWKINDYTDDGRVEIRTYSPAGEDFSICVDVENFPEAVLKYWKGFDQDYHIEMWIGARRNGIGGVPSTRELARDAEAIDNMLKELAEALIDAKAGTLPKAWTETEENPSIKAEKLFRLMRENPELPVVPMVDADVVAEDGGYWIGSWGDSSVDEYISTESGIVLKSDNDINDALLKCLSMEEYEALPDDTESEHRTYEELPWIKAILVSITLPE